MQTYERHYSSDEFNDRYRTYKNNKDFVDRWNSRDNQQTILELNHLADVSHVEYRARYLQAYRFNAVAHSNFDYQPPRQRLRSESEYHDSVTGATIDWTKHGAVTPVEDQGACSAGYAFAAAGAIESYHRINYPDNGKLTTLSKQNIIDCSTSQGNKGCTGGSTVNAFKYVVANLGIDTESSYPYTNGSVSSCHYKKTSDIISIKGYSSVKSGDEDLSFVDALAWAVEDAPVAASIDASHQSFQFYKTATTGATTASASASSGGSGSGTASASSGTTYSGSAGTTTSGTGSGGSSTGGHTDNTSDVSSGHASSNTIGETPYQTSLTNYWIVKNSYGDLWGQAAAVFTRRSSILVFNILR
eukprot:gene6186-7165_t